MPTRLILPVLLLLPLAEIAVFVLVGQRIGVFATIGLVLLSTVIGFIVIRIQGVGMAKSLNAAQMNAQEAGNRMIGGMLHMVAGLLLAVPGFITSTIGLLLLLPLTRYAVWKLLKPDVIIQTSGFARRPSASHGERHPPGPSVIDLDEGDFHRENDGKDKPGNGGTGRSPWSGPSGTLPE